MKKMTIEETKMTTGGALSGALISGVADITNAITNFITSMAGIAFIFEGKDQTHTKGDFDFGKNLSFNWDDTKPKGENLFLDQINHTGAESHFDSNNDAYDLT